MDKKKFASGVCFKKIFFMFLIGCVIGVAWEECYLFIKRLVLDYDDTSWRSHAGLVYGPFNPVYGAGAAVLTIALCKKERSNLSIFIIASILGGATEYIASLFQEFFFQTHSWEYSDHFLNLHGRTNLLYALFFGFLGLLFVKYLYPYLSNKIESMKPKLGNIIFYFMLVFMIFNIFISIAAVNRQTERHNEIPANGYLDEFCDERFPDERLNKIYVNKVIK